MGDGFINFANIGWLILLGIGYVGVVKWEEVPPNVKGQLQNFLDRMGLLSPVYVLLAFWLIARVMFALGWQLQLELMVVVMTCNYVFKQTTRIKKNFYFNLHKEISESTDAARILGNHLPEWVTFPSANRVQWLNTVLQGMWPSIVQATETSVKGILPPILNAAKPSVVYGFSLRAANIGKNPMVINGVQHHVYGSTETTLDLSLSWNADMDFRLLVKVPGPDVEVKIKDFEMRMTLRVTLGPHIPQWPCFANMVVSLVGQPEIDFDLQAGKVPVDSVPGLGGFLDDFIRHTLTGLMAYPKGIVIPIVQGYKIDIGKAAGALGTLKVSFLRVDNFLGKFSKYKKTPFYVKIELLDSGMKRVRGKPYTGLTASMSDVFSFTLYDTTGTIRIWLYFDVVGSDICVGMRDISTSELINCDEDEEIEVMLFKESDPANRRRASVYIKAEMLKLTSAKQEEAPKHPPEDPAPPHDVSPEFIQSLGDAAPPVPKNRGPVSVRGLRQGVPYSGVIFARVESAEDLRNMERVGTSDPCVFLRINSSIAKSEYIKSNLNPTFNFEAELLVTNSEKDVVQIHIIDKNDIGKDKLMGELTIDVKTILKCRGETMTGTFDLTPQGRVSLNLRFIAHGQ
ncbi:calcium-dependent lipid binding protein [Angomonas deanei]|nr:calcium-dependent lipid binding protein [Angomonas deanei]|eukprot:EPY26121.1 calcium-dependent lipid binding protein [Angomonas deanei]